MIRNAASLRIRVQSDSLSRIEGSLLRIKRLLIRVKGIGLRIKKLRNVLFVSQKCHILCPQVTSSTINYCCYSASSNCHLPIGRFPPQTATLIYMQRNNEHPVAIEGSLCVRVRFHSETILIAIVLFYASKYVNVV